MRLYLMQHGEAVDKAVDAERPLSAKGRHDVERIAAFVAGAGVHVSQVWHSGKTRARQSAVILADQVGGKAVEIEGLRPDDDIAILLKRVDREHGDIAIAGHLPHLSLLAAKLLGAKGDLEPVRFQRGGIAALERADDGAWQLCWMITPDLLLH